MGDEGPQAPPGWYPDAGSQRYWDGNEWSEPPTDVMNHPPRPAPPQPPPGDGRPDALNRLANQFSVFWLATLSCVLMVVGGLGTWATALGVVSINGTRGDGWIAVAAAVGSLCALWGWAMRPRTWLMLAAALLATGSAVAVGIDLHKIAGIGASSFFGRQVQLVHPAWGIYLAMGASVALAGFALATAGLGAPDSSGGTRERGSNAGIAVATIVVAIGVVIVVAHAGTSHASSSSLAASTTAETTSREEPNTSTETTETSAGSSEPTTTAEQTEQPASTDNSGSSGEGTAMSALNAYWSDISAHDFASAYSQLGAASAGLNESQFIASEEKAGIGSVHFEGRTASASPSAATIEVVSLVTHDREYGCRTWTGSYTLSKASGSWLVERAELNPTSCSN